MIAVDTNLLVYGHRVESQWHDVAASRIRELAEGPGLWALPWPCLHEFLAIVTHPRIWDPPTPLPAAMDQVSAWMESPTVVLLSESHGYWGGLRELLRKGRIQGPRVHDARVAALCVTHGVRELWTADRDFGRFRDLKTRNPLTH